jgi:3,4-dihydroxy 2-butanone 4-phosphate synthase/GTP cyclohydrolase II
MACARIPTDAGEFSLCLYHNSLDGKEHLALIAGDLGDGVDVLVRVHSECFTGDVLGSLRCDCGPQLVAAMRLIAREGRGIILYLRQEGRGIGLLEKLRSYNLQDIGYDTVDANLLLGHQADLRDYSVAALMLGDLGVQTVRLLTNNPDKIVGLERAGIPVVERVPIETSVNAENAYYLDTKVRRMRHLLQLDKQEVDQLLSKRPEMAANGQFGAALTEAIRPSEALRELLVLPPGRGGRPFVTLSYAQSLDGSIAARRGETTAISGPEALRLTHQLRAQHDAILVGIGTVIADDPRLNVRLVRGPDPQPVVVDSRLRFPSWSRLLREPGRRPWIVTTEAADRGRQSKLEAAGARIIRLPAGPDGLVSLPVLLDFLAGSSAHIRSVMVEGGATVISNFLAGYLADRLVLTIAPLLLGGLNAVTNLGPLNGQGFPRLAKPRYQAMGQDVVLFGDLVWE